MRSFLSALLVLVMALFGAASGLELSTQQYLAAVDEDSSRPRALLQGIRSFKAGTQTPNKPAQPKFSTSNQGNRRSLLQGVRTFKSGSQTPNKPKAPKFSSSTNTGGRRSLLQGVRTFKSGSQTPNKPKAPKFSSGSSKP